MEALHLGRSSISIWMVFAAASAGFFVKRLSERNPIRPETPRTEDPALTVSVGVASYPKDADTIGTLLRSGQAYLCNKRQPRAARGQSCLTRQGQINSV